MDDFPRCGASLGRRGFLVGAAMVMAAPRSARAGGVDGDSALSRAGTLRRRARHAEHAGARESVDLYYEAVVFACAAMSAEPSGKAVALYNECLAGCLRAATRFGAIDARSHLTVNTPRGTLHVPILHRGFVWSPSDFHRLLEPEDAPRNPANTRDHRRPGVGAAQVVRRANPRVAADDAFLPDPAYFPATALLRPNLDAWLGPGAPGGDVLELHDPLRTPSVTIAGACRPLAADLDAPIAFLEDAACGLESGWGGLLRPSQDVDRAFLGLLEPHQPGRIPVYFIHGLYDTPYTFTDLMNGLRMTPGFLDRFQIAGCRYATGLTILHAAALMRRDLHRFSDALDPSRIDPGMQDGVLIGHSMGGLMMKFQMTSSGDAVWRLASHRPLASLATPPPSRAFLESLFYFDPVPSIRRGIFLAPPHDGLSMAAQPGASLSELLTRRPRDLDPLLAQLSRDNPGALHPYAHDLPNSIGMLRRREPLLNTLRHLPISPAIRFHTLAGTARVPASIAHGDGVVPIASAHHDGAESETLVPETHTTINASEYTLVEVRRILGLHAAG